MRNGRLPDDEDGAVFYKRFCFRAGKIAGAGGCVGWLRYELRRQGIGLRFAPAGGG